MIRTLRSLGAVFTGIYATHRSMTGGPGFRGPPSDHFDGRVFRNQSGSAGKSFADFWRWQRTRRPVPWPRWVEHQATPELERTPESRDIAVTFINHITFLIQYPGLNVLTDPVFSDRVSPVQWAGPRRVHAPGIPLGALPPIDLVLLSHNHYDHLDLAALRALAARHGPTIVTGLGNRGFLVDHGIQDVVELDWWQSCSVRGANVCFTPAQHWSGRGLRGRNRTLWGGFVLRAAGRALYFAGDSGFGSHFAAIRDRLGPPFVALLPIGAYAPRWFMGEQHMDPDDAVRAHLALDARTSIATHFGCFQLTDEAIDAPPAELRAALARHGVAADSFRIPEVGGTLRFASD